MSNTKNRLGRDFWWFRSGDFLSGFGNSAHTLAISWWVLEITGSASSMSLILLPTLIASLLLSTLLAPFGDRFARRSLMLLGNLGLTLSTIMLFILFNFELMTLPLLIAINLLNVFFFSLYRTGSNSVIPNLVAKPLLQKAYQAIQGLDAIKMIGGGIYGASLVATIGIKGAIGFNAISFLASFIGVFMIKSNTHPEQTERSFTVKLWKEDLLQGFKLTFHAKTILGFILFSTFINMFMSPLFLLLPFTIKELLNLTPWHIGIAETSLGLGALIGALSLGLTTHYINAYRLLMISRLMPIAAFATVYFLQDYWVLVIALGFVAISSTWFNTLVSSRMALVIPDNFRSRVMSAMNLLTRVSVPLGLLITGYLMDTYSGWQIFLGYSLLNVICFFLFFTIPKAHSFLNIKSKDSQSWFEDNYYQSFKTKLAEKTTN